jgi:DNA-binding CsgD family transcriptional regulator
MKHLKNPRADIRLPTISPRELEVWRGIGLGLSGKALAAHLGVSVKTVDSHREHIKDKLASVNLGNRSENTTAWLVSLAFQLGIVTTEVHPDLVDLSVGQARRARHLHQTLSVVTKTNHEK